MSRITPRTPLPPPAIKATQNGNHPRESRRCGASACPARPSPVGSAGRSRPSACVLRRLGLGRLAALDAKPAVVRYERERPGELIHIDTKKLGRIDGVGHRITGDRRPATRRGIGWEHLHVAIDDASRLAYTEILPDERKESACAFLDRALAFFAGHRRHRRAGHDRQRLGLSQPSLPPDACRIAGLRHKRTRPYTPRTNGKAERFIQTSLREWAYLHAFATSAERTAAMRPGSTATTASDPTQPSPANLPLTAEQGQPPWKRQLER